MPRYAVRVLVCLSALAAVAAAFICSQHTYLGNNPDEGNPGWHEEAQGLTHDADFWYATQNRSDGDPRLWRIPVTRDLGAGVSCGSGGVSCSDYGDTPLSDHGYNHYGDPDFYQFGGTPYLLVPIENGDAGPGVAIFRGDASLAFLAFAPFPGQTHAGWVAVDPDGVLLSSEGEDVPQFNRFYLDWALFQSSGENAFTLQPLPPIVLQDETGSPLTLLGAQGGEFSDDGQLLYFSNGYGSLAEATWGVHVFERRTTAGDECGSTADPCLIARRLEHSHNGPGGFAYEFNTSNGEEPEGLTYWDLDADGRAPGLRGQLHVVLLDNDWPDADDVYVKHYRVSFEDHVPPVIACPLPATAECSVHGGVPDSDPQLEAFFSSVSAVDACDEHPLITNDAPSQFSLGATSVRFTATDASQNAASCSAQVTVIDTTSPSLTCPAPIAVECTSPSGVSAGDPQLEPFFAAAAAIDRCDAAPALTNDAPLTLPIGSTPVNFVAGDASGNLQACQSSVHVGDTTPPQVTLAVSSSVLSPPDHRLIPIRVTVTASDRCGGVSYQLVSITSNEPDEGLGDADTTGDIQDAAFGTPDTAFLLRAERSGAGTGRVYTIVYAVSDSAGNTTTATAYVSVPHH